MKTTISVLISAALLASGTGAHAADPAHGVPRTPSEPAAIALARKALGKACHFRAGRVGPEIADYTRLPPSVGQIAAAGGFVFVRERGAQRVAFLAVDHGEEDGCSVADFQPLPPRAAKETFLDCHVDDPNPKAVLPISRGLGLRQNGSKALAAYLEMDVRHGKLLPRAGDDSRIRCGGFETGE